VTSNGDGNVLIICPPGITISSIQELVAGSLSTLAAGTHYDSFTIPGITDANNANPKPYTCYYARDLNSTTFGVRDIRFTTLGTVVP